MIHRGVEGLLKADVAFLRGQAADLVGRVVGERLPQPGGLLLFAEARQLVHRQMRFEQGLLHDAGHIKLGLRSSRRLQPGQNVRYAWKRCRRVRLRSCSFISFLCLSRRNR